MEYKHFDELERRSVWDDNNKFTAAPLNNSSKYLLPSKDLDEQMPSDPRKISDREGCLDELATIPNPYLEQYFKEMGNYVDLLSCVHVGKVSTNEDLMCYVKDKLDGWHKNRGTQLMVKAVLHHDTNLDGVLDPEESQLFFEQLLECYVNFSVFMADTIISMIIDMQLHADPSTRDDPGPAKMMIMSQVQPRLDFQFEAFNDWFAAFFNDDARMANGSKIAFAMMDINGDGVLQVGEVLTTLSPGSEEQKAFYKAFDLDADAILAKAGEEFDMLQQ